MRIIPFPSVSLPFRFPSFSSSHPFQPQIFLLTPRHHAPQVLTALEEGIARGDIADGSVTDEALAGFLSEHGRRFYGLAPATRQIRLTRGAAAIDESLRGDGGVEVVPFRAGEPTWGVEWL